MILGIDMTMLGRQRNSASSLLLGLSHYWLLNEESGTRAASVGGADMVDTNGTTFTATTPWGGKAAQFATASDRMLKTTTSAYTVNLPPTGQKRTFNFWWNCTDVTGSGKHFTGQWTASSSEQSWSMQMWTDGAPYINIVYGTLKQLSWSSAGLDNGTWHMATIIFDGTARTGTLIIDNGTPLTSEAGTGNGDNGYTLTIGAVEQYYTTLSIPGAIGLYGVWGRELTAAEITYLYNNGNGRPYPF